MIRVEELSKHYGETRALSSVSFEISAGEVVGLLGPNGAGKTTTMKILVGYLLPTSGKAVVSGIDVCEDPLEVQRQIGYLPENAPLYSDMLVGEYLTFMGEMRGLELETRQRRRRQVIEECGLGSVVRRPIDQLSKGFRQRVGLAAALLHDPPILILDEPTTGLDPNQIVEIRELIRRMGETKTVIFSTHILSEVEAVCSRAVIVIDGRIRADGALDELTQSSEQVVSLMAPDVDEALAALAALDRVTQVLHMGSSGGFHDFRMNLDAGDGVGESIWRLASERGWPVRELRRDERSLEQVFRQLTESCIDSDVAMEARR